MKKTTTSMLVAALILLDLTPVRAVDYHVATAQQLQNALTLAASDGANNNIWITNGYYTGNFNYNSSSANSLTVLPEVGVANTQITIDGAGTGSSLNISCSANATITVQGITILRNCGNTVADENIGALRIAAGGGSTILVNGCLFLSPTNAAGIGLLLASGLNAIVTNCNAAGMINSDELGGTGISISGVTGNVTVQNCTMTANSSGYYGAYGINVTGASVIAITGNIFAGNDGGASCSGGTVTLTGNIFNGNSAYELTGGASCSGTTVTLTGNVFNGNSSTYDTGGASCSGTTVTLTGNTFMGNSSYIGGAGGASCSGTPLTLTANTFTDNSATTYNVGVGGGYGGGVNCDGTVTLFNNTFTGNLADIGGGAVCSGTVILSNNTFTGNSATSSGGGGYAGGYYNSSGGTMTLSGNIFQQNSAALSGGGIYALGQSINLLDNLVVNNSQGSSSSQGGGIWVDATSNLFMINNTVTGNTSAGSGGGAAYVVTGTVELLNVYNNIIWGNSASGNGGDVYLAGTGQKKVFDFNDVDSMYGVWDIAATNIDLSPQFFNPVSGDYHTQNTSPCIAAGTTNAPSLPATDLDGNPRIANGAVDLGCYEYTTNVVHPADTNGNFVITAAKFNAYAAAWQNGQTWSNGPNPGPNPIPANYVTRAGYLMTNNGGAYTNDGSARPVNWKTVP
jgi:predicted outer membrane repeat protein